MRQINTLDRLGAYDAAAHVVRWIFSGPVVRLHNGVHVYVSPDGHPHRVPASLIDPGRKS